MKLFSVATTIAVALMPVAVHAGVIFADNFDSNTGGTIASGAVDSSVTGTFTVTAGNIDVVGPAFFPSLCNTSPETGSCIDMDGSTAGQITSSLITLGPGNYTLSFDLFGSERGANASTTVTFGTFYSNTFNTASADQNIVSSTFDVATGTTANIVFTSNDGGGATEGTLVDNVTLTQNSLAGVPEPGSALLLLTALPVLWVARRYAR